jgi:hypothetical protein
VSGIARRANFSFASRNSFLSHEACRLTAAAQNGDRARLTGAALHALAQVRPRLPGAALHALAQVRHPGWRRLPGER